MVAFAATFAVALLAHGYLMGRFRGRLVVDDLHLSAVGVFLGVAVAAVARNLGAPWWPVALAAPAAFALGHAYAVAVGSGARGNARRVRLFQRGDVLLVEKKKEQR